MKELRAFVAVWHVLPGVRAVWLVLTCVRAVWLVLTCVRAAVGAQGGSSLAVCYLFLIALCVAGRVIGNCVVMEPCTFK